MNDDGDDDIALIALAKAATQSTQAMTELVRATGPAVFRMCAALVDRPSAEDLTQETYLRAMRSLATFRGDSSPLRWLLTIARRVCAEEIAGRQRRRQLESRLRLERRDTSREPTAQVELTDALDHLSAERREAFVLTVVTGLSYADAALVCGCPIGTIRSRVARARDDLARALGDSDAAMSAAAAG